MLKKTKIYPGASATAAQVLRLAEEYRKAAQLLIPLGRAPYRLCAIHSIELYLNALLLQEGHEPSRIREMQHNLSVRTERAIDRGLKLKQRTAAHLSAMTGNREYLLTRYEPEMPPTTSQINRVKATLDEVADKVTAMMKVAG